MTKTRYHLSQSLRGALMHWKDRDWKGVCRRDDGTLMSPQEVKAAFLDELAQGHEVIPFDSTCDNFDWQKGCQGHPVPEDQL